MSSVRQRHPLPIRPSLLLAVILVVAALVVPIIAALYFAQRHAENEERAYAESMAAEVLRRGVLLRQQIVLATDPRRSSPAPLCSPVALQRMREIALAAAYVQGVGEVRNGRLLCSSFGLHGEGISLGPSLGRTAAGIQSWLNVELPFAPGQRFNVYERGGYAAIVHLGYVIDIPLLDPSMVIALMISSPTAVTRSQGSVDPAWLSLYTPYRSATFVLPEHLVAFKASPDQNIAALAAVPRDLVRERTRQLALVLLPIGLLAGLMLVVGIGLIARQDRGPRQAIRAAMRRHELFIRYQPVFELHNGRCSGAEALLRWQRADGTMVPPDSFIPVAEEFGFSQEIACYVIDIVTRDLPALLALQPEFRLGINFSAHDLLPGGPGAYLCEQLRPLQLPPDSGNVVVEITERGLAEPAVVLPMIEQLHAMGVHVAVDDFGTGYSSLAMLESIPLDYLKIDKSFVATIGANAASSQVVPHIIEMAKTLKLVMVAEGVEQQAQADYLRERGVQRAQGWLFSRAVPLEELLELLRTQDG